MKIEIKLPQWNMGMAVGTITKWLKQAGDHVVEDEAIAEVESEKATNELLAPKSGTITEILVSEGDTISVSGVLAIMEADD